MPGTSPRPHPTPLRRLQPPSPFPHPPTHTPTSSADFKRNCWLAIPACITARAWRTCRDACLDCLPAVAGKTIPAFPAHAHPQLYASGKKPILSHCWSGLLLSSNTMLWWESIEYQLKNRSQLVWWKDILLSLNWLPWYVRHTYTHIYNWVGQPFAEECSIWMQSYLSLEQLVKTFCLPTGGFMISAITNPACKERFI